MSSISPDPESAALIWQLHRELNGLTRASRRVSSTNLVSLDPMKREPRLPAKNRTRSTSQEPGPEASLEDGAAYHASKKPKKEPALERNSSGPTSVPKKQVQRDSNSGLPSQSNNSNITPSVEARSKPANISTTFSETANSDAEALPQSRGLQKGPSSSGIDPRGGDRSKPSHTSQAAKPKQSHLHHLLHKEHLAAVAPSPESPLTTETESLQHLSRKRTDAPTGKASPQQPKKSDGKPVLDPKVHSAAQKGGAPKARDEKQSVSQKQQLVERTKVAITAANLPPPAPPAPTQQQQQQQQQQQPQTKPLAELPPAPLPADEPLASAPAPTPVPCAPPPPVPPPPPKSPLELASSAASGGVRKAVSSRPQEPTTEQAAPRRVKCFHVGVRWGINLQEDLLKSRSDLAAALNDAFAGQILSCGRGEKMTVVFLDSRGRAYEVPSLRASGGKESSVKWKSYVEQCVKVYIR